MKPVYVDHASWVQQLTWNVHRLHRRHAWAFLPILWLSCATPKAGTSCVMPDAYCASAKTERICSAGTLQDTPCPGPKGCSVDSDRNVVCDQSAGAIIGQGCLPDNEGRGQCSTDGGTLLQCISGTWAGAACPQGAACHVDAAGVLCR